MKDEGLDFLPMILLLGLCIFVAFGCILPIWKDSRLDYIETYDKSLGKVQGIKYNSDVEIDSHLTYQELVVALSTQSEFMPYPPVIDVFGNAYLVQHTDDTASWVGAEDYIPNNRATIDSIKNDVYDWCVAATARYNNPGSVIDGFKLHFKMMFTVGESEDTTDDCYTIYAIAKNSFGRNVYLRCLPGGEIEGLPTNFGDLETNVEILQY